MKPLPATYLEHLEAQEPGFLKIAKDSAARLKERGIAPLANARDIGTNDDAYDKLVTRKQAEMAAHLARARHIPLKEIEEKMRQGDFDDEIAVLIAKAGGSYILATRHFLAGERIYYCADGLVDRLMHTDVCVPVDLLKLPFHHIMLVISSPEAAGRFAKQHGAKVGNSRPMSITITALEDDDGLSWQIIITQTKGKRMLASDHRMLRLTAGLTSDQIIQQDHAPHGSHLQAGQYQRIRSFLPSLRELDVLNTFNSDHLWLYRLIVNLVLYITSAKPELGWPRKNGREHIGDRVNFSPREHIVVGENVTRLVRYVEPPATSTAVRGGGRVLERQVIVAGHWKAQAHGPQRQLRRSIWIEPYERGPDIASLVTRPVLVR